MSSEDEVLLVPADRPRPGEVWAFVNDRGDVIVHRCLIRNGGRALFKGDGNDHSDGYIGAGRLVGRATVIRRGTEERPVRRILGILPGARWALRAAHRRVRRLLR